MEKLKEEGWKDFRVSDKGILMGRPPESSKGFWIGIPLYKAPKMCKKCQKKNHYQSISDPEIKKLTAQIEYLKKELAMRIKWGGRAT